MDLSIPAALMIRYSDNTKRPHGDYVIYVATKNLRDKRWEEDNEAWVLFRKPFRFWRICVFRNGSCQHKEVVT